MAEDAGSYARPAETVVVTTNPRAFLAASELERRCSSIATQAGTIFGRSNGGCPA